MALELNFWVKISKKALWIRLFSGDQKFYEYGESYNPRQNSKIQ